MPGRTGLAAGLAGLTGVLALALPATVDTTGAVFSDAADTATGALATGRFVPAAAGTVTCSTTGLLPSTIRFTTPTVAALPRGTVQYVARLSRVAQPQTVVFEGLMTVSGSTASIDFGGTLLSGLGTANYRISVTTRLSAQTLESSPAATATFSYGLLVLGVFGCGTA